MFATEEAGLLPAVTEQRWDTRRHVPVPTDHVDLPQTHSEKEYVLAVVDYVSLLLGRAAVDALYGGARPTFCMDGPRIQDNLPAGSPPLKDFVLDLGYVYNTVMHSVSSDQLSKARAYVACT
jgi:hypothetical protein